MFKDRVIPAGPLRERGGRRAHSWISSIVGGAWFLSREGGTRYVLQGQTLSPSLEFGLRQAG